MTGTTIMSELSTAQRDAAERIDGLDLEPIAYKLIHPEPGETAMTLAEADQLIAAYRCFLKLCAWYPEEPIVPSKAIDEVWHAHMLDNAKFNDDSMFVFGFILHHFPYFGLRGADDEAALRAAYERTCDLFRQHFGIDPRDGRQPKCSTACQVGKCSGTQCNGGSCHSAALDQDRPRPDRSSDAR